MRRGGPQGGGVQPGGADPDQDRRGRGRHREGTNWLFRIRLRIVQSFRSRSYPFYSGILGNKKPLLKRASLGNEPQFRYNFFKTSLGHNALKVGLKNRAIKSLM